jgi:hypothetical protein
MEIVRSINGVPIRLTGERWTHIVESHDELAGRMSEVLLTISEPDWITEGKAGVLVSWREISRNKYICALYKEVSRKDGFVITAFLTKKPKKEPKIWPLNH